MQTHTHLNNETNRIIKINEYLIEEIEEKKKIRIKESLEEQPTSKQSCLNET